MIGGSAMEQKTLRLTRAALLAALALGLSYILPDIFQLPSLEFLVFT